MYEPVHVPAKAEVPGAACAAWAVPPMTPASATMTAAVILMLPILKLRLLIFRLTLPGELVLLFRVNAGDVASAAAEDVQP
jgi:hypothetical protein